MKIGVLSDTHLTGDSLALNRIVDTYFHDADMIFHAGDIVEIDVLDVFLPKRVEAVAGNMDSVGVRSQIPIKKVITIGTFKIGLIHGWGSPAGIENRIRKEFVDIDCIVFGHTHYPINQVIEGILFFNPGSALEKRFTKKNTIGILEITDKIDGKIIEV
jgi:putative phosphoesterase